MRMWPLVSAALALCAAGCRTEKTDLWENDATSDPVRVGRLVMGQFLSTEPCDFNPRGYDGGGYGGGKWLPYANASWWAHGLAFAQATGDTAMRDRLIAMYDAYKAGGRYADTVGRMYDVDDTISGVVPLAIYLANGDKAMRDLGLVYADTQWTPPCEASITGRHAAPVEQQWKWWNAGYTPQTRLWIDDMYMIIAIQTMAYRVTGERKYLDRTAKEMCYYLDELQLKDGDVKGLFYHAPDVPFIWGRGDGWMAAGMALVLSQLEESHPCRAKILRGYRDMMAALLKYQRPDGLWGQLVNEPETWSESSGSAMFTYALIVGVKRGWLCRCTYLPAAERAWKRLCSSLDEYGNVPSVCIGTGKRNDHQYYLDRRRINGDPHGEAPMMWCVNALLETDARRL